MAYQSGPFIAALAAAAGDDLVLQDELRRAFSDSVRRQADLIRRARCDGNWDVATTRLHTIAASFHATDLIELAARARDSAPGDPVVIRDIERFLAQLDEVG